MPVWPPSSSWAWRYVSDVDGPRRSGGALGAKVLKGLTAAAEPSEKVLRFPKPTLKMADSELCRTAAEQHVFHRAPGRAIKSHTNRQGQMLIARIASEKPLPCPS